MYCLVKIRKKVAFTMIFSLVTLISASLVTAVKAQSQVVELPIIMYHSILKDENYWGDYVISPEQLEADFEYLSQNGYTAIGMTELYNYLYLGEDLPEKPIILSFDDGYYNNYLYAYPLALEYNMKIIISPIAYYSDINTVDEVQSGYYSHCTWEQIQEMYNSGLVEFGNHSYNLHSDSGERLGTKMLTWEDEETYKQLLQEDLSKAQDLLTQATGIATKLFVYPFGAISEQAQSVIESMGFICTFSCEEKMNLISKDPSSIEVLGRYLRPYNKSVSEILGGI